ncbi:chitobiase/beta-hexosaminidase C-terminal domain-containing protein, partial [Thermodesulfobacteriota bacterium]
FIYTRTGGDSANSNTPDFYGSMQHPLLDDNVDGYGSNLLSEGYGDGQTAQEIYLGIGLNYDTNSLENPAEVLEATETLYLNSTATSAMIWAQANDDTQVGSAWIEIRSPSKILSSGGGTGQLEIELDKYFLNAPGTIHPNYWGRIYENFIEDGKYEIFYFVRDKETEEISPMKRSVVYKARDVNNPPGSFSLLLPQNTSEQKTVLIFDWQDAIDLDPEDMVIYNLVIARDITFNDVVFRREEIPVSLTHVDEAAGLEDNTWYYWKVEAVDPYGNRTISNEIWSFKTNNTNAFPGFIKGMVYNGLDRAIIEGANLTTSLGWANAISLSNGSFIMVVPAGTTNLSCAKTGYETASIPEIEVASGSTKTINLMMLPQGAEADTETPISSASPHGGSYLDSQAVSLTCSDMEGSGCYAIYYTTGDIEPTVGSPTYSEPIIIDSSTTLKFFARDNAGNSEPVHTEFYTIIPVKGNVNRDGVVDLVDAILAMKVINDIATGDETISIDADVDGNNQIGIAEIIFILQKVSGLRP